MTSALVHYAAEESGPSPLQVPVGELIIGIICFAILCWVLMKYAFPMFEKTYQERTDAIQGGLKRAEEAQTEAARLLEQYRQQLAEARAEASHIREQAKEQAANISADLRRQGEAERDRIIEAGKQQLAAERERLVQELRGDVGRLAVELSSRIIGEALADEAAQRGTVDRFLADLETADGRLSAGSK
jgi:F-type H+-transporting ATPase subunit b